VGGSICVRSRVHTEKKCKVKNFEDPIFFYIFVDCAARPIKQDPLYVKIYFNLFLYFQYL